VARDADGAPRFGRDISSDITLAELEHGKPVMITIDRNSSNRLRGRVERCLLATLVASLGASALLAQHGHGSEGIGKAHMEISCAPAVQPAFDRALALLHNFWYARALARFRKSRRQIPTAPWPTGARR
jgi:hypothetical protein